MSKWIIDNRAKGMKSDINFLLRLKRTHNDKMDRGSHYQNYFIDCKNGCHNIRRRSIGDKGLLFHPLKAFNKVFNSGDLSVKVILWCQIRKPRTFAGTRSVLKGLANSFVHELLVSLMKWDVKRLEWEWVLYITWIEIYEGFVISNQNIQPQKDYYKKQLVWLSNYCTTFSLIIVFL